MNPAKPVPPAGCLAAALALSMATTCDGNGTATMPAPLSLNGTWELRMDLDGVGETEGWQHPGASGTWTAVKVPSAFNVAPNPPPQVAAEGPHWTVGKAWYRRQVPIPPDWPAGGHALLRLDGVLLRARAWWDGVEIGTNRFGQVPVAFDLGEVVPGSVHQVVVQTDNTVLEKAIPDPEWDGWWNHGGITRAVTLEGRLGPARISQIWMETTQTSAGWEARIFVAVEGAGDAPPPVAVELRAPDGSIVLRGAVTLPAGGGPGSIVARPAEVHPWTPDSPTLYPLTASIPGHQRTVHVGFREIRIDGTRLLLNGTPIRLLGVNRHEDVPGTGPVVPIEQARADLLDIKALGSNTLRMAHYPDDPRVFDLCDELGLLVWAEIPAWHTSEYVLGDPEVQKEWGEGWLNAMITAHRHHPSVILWSVGNEFPSHTERAESYCRRTMEFARALDPTRPVVYASDKHELAAAGLQMDLCLPHADLIAVNEYYGWYYGGNDDVGPTLDALHAFFPDRPILVSEFGAEAPPGVHADPLPQDWSMAAPYTEEYQVAFLQRHLDAILDPSRADWMLGALVWVYADFPDPHRVGWTHPPAWNYQNCKGLVSRDRVRKPSYDTVRAAFTPPRD